MSDVLDRLKAALADRYHVERELDSGGMAVVYLAEDLRHERRVAIKVLRPELTSVVAAERFLREIKLTAALAHPHILPVHDSGEADGLLYYVMPYVDGESLRKRLDREKRLSGDEAVRIAREVADALSYAHDHELLHRDIKPENILLEAGHAVVADFGIAKALSEAAGDRLTDTGVSIGTPAYMSPEQAAGEADVDGRSDVYSLTCVLYEMLTGEPPFKGTPRAVIAKHIMDAPPSIQRVLSSVSERTAHAIERALAKDPQERFATAREFTKALEPVSESAGRRVGLAKVAGLYAAISVAVLAAAYFLMLQLGLPDWFLPGAVVMLLVCLPIILATALVQGATASARAEGAEAAPSSVASRFLTWRNAKIVSLVALAVWSLITTAWLVMNRTGTVKVAVADEAEPGIAVLPFSARGEGMEVWREGMVDLLSANLDGVPGLRSIDSRTVFARWREAVPESGEVDQTAALRIARATGAEYALLGSAVSLGGEVRLTADIYDTETGSGMGQAQVQGSPDSILSLVDRLAVQSLVVTMQQVESELPEIDLASVTTSSVPALRAWLEGEVHFRRGYDVAAAAAYARALDHDSTFAFAYYRLSSAYGWAEGMWGNRAEQARAQAFRWADRLPPRQADLMRGLHAWDTGEYREAHRILWSLTQRYPDYADAWHQLGDFYYHSGPAIPVSLDEARECFERAVQLDPSFATYRIHLIDLAFKHDPDSARIADMLAEYKQLASADARVTLQLEASFDLAFGSEDRRARRLQGLDTLSNLGMLPSNNLLHPRFWRAREAVYLAMERRRNRLYLNELFFGAASGRGLAREGFAYLDRPQVWPEYRACITLMWQQNGFQVSDERRAEFDILINQVDSLETTFLLYCAGVHAADRGRWDVHANAIDLLGEASRRSIAAGGSGLAARAGAAAVEAWGHWRQGNEDAALAALSDFRRYDATNFVRWTLEFILTDLERWNEAIPYLKAGWWYTNSFTNYKLARAYEHTGEHDKARKEYAFFIDAWQDADPELQPWVEDTRRALERLTGDR